jgi:hypothetical protein
MAGIFAARRQRTCGVAAIVAVYAAPVMRG